MSIRKQTISGVKWTTVSTITLTVVNLLKISVLARFLDRADFGLMALVTFVLGFMNLFMDMGLTSAILHRQKITKHEYASLYWVNVVFSIALTAIIIILSPLIAGFYNEPELSILIPLMSLSIILSALGRQFRTIEQKELHFKYLGIIDIVSAVIGLIVGVVMAVMGFGVYALVFGSLAISSVSNVVFFTKGLAAHGMLLHFNYREAKPFLRIGIYQVGGQVINYFNRDLDVLIIGKFFGTEILGGYSLAKQLVRRPLAIINPIITKVGVSVLPKYQNNHNALKRYFVKLTEGKGVISALVYGSMSILAYYLVLVFYGKDYLYIVPFVQLFTILIYFRTMGGIMGILAITKGRTDYEFYWNMLTTLLMPAAIILGAMHSLSMIIVSMTLVQFVLLIPGWYFFYKRLIGLDFLPFLKPNIIPAVIAAFWLLIAVLFNVNILLEVILVALLATSLFVYSYFSISDVTLHTNKIIRKYARL